MPLQAVIFDIGGVLIRTEDLAPRRQWEKRLGLPEWGLADLVFNSPASRRASVGQATREDVWAEVMREFSLTPAELEALIADFWAGDAWDKALLGFIHSLRPRLKTGIISNAWPDARENVRRHINGETFDVILFSAEEGIEKPDSEIYRRALARLDIAPAEAVFVDDMLVNVEAARALGMKGVHFQPGSDVRTEFRKIGIGD
jgi:epoxide hydrolase-like predicted phosphatase